MLNTPATFAAEVNKLIFDFIWKHKIPKIKKSTLVKDKKKGGLNMIDFTLFDKLSIKNMLGKTSLLRR